MNRKIWKKAAALFCALAMLPALAACGGDGEDSGFREGPRFTVAVAEPLDSANPAAAESATAKEIFLLCYDPLWRINAAGEPVPCLVDNWSLSSDRLTWTIRLRQDVTFSDGTPLTARDVVFTYEMMQSCSDVYGGYFDGIAAIRQTDDYTLVITTDYVKGDMMYNPTPILPEALWRSYEFSPLEFENAAMVGTGPFVYDAAGSGEEGWLLRARADYWGDTPLLGSVYFAEYGTVTGAARAIAAGEVDACFGLTDVQLTTLESVPGVELIQSLLPGAPCWAMVFNTRSKAFENQTLRQSMEYLTDREWILSMASGGVGQTGSVFASPGTDYFTQPVGLRSFSEITAGNYIRSAGYADSNGDGILESTREEDLSLVVYTSNADGWASTAATVVTRAMEDAGIAVNWKKTDGPVEQECGPKDEWDVCFVAWNGDRDAAYAAGAFAEKMESLAGWTSEEFSTVLGQLRAADEPVTLRGYASRLEQIAYDECPCVVLGYPADVQALRSDGWTGYEEALAAAGSAFGIGSYDVYMHLTPSAEE